MRAPPGVRQAAGFQAVELKMKNPGKEKQKIQHSTERKNSTPVERSTFTAMSLPEFNTRYLSL
jgi:hypothetical protein